ncbi:hypothetical protein [Amycolatopsis aidingensis]|uniref:hypothetical protein n=1 Tax=Amycolatopsis aidingensis TaxID=2842453 RepID=UPI001C0BF6C1|nr:hypothetical protein [Amycolatopsis aidingensis]
MTTPVTTAPSAAVRRPRRLYRRICGYGVIVAVLPYLTLKVLWVFDVMVGVPPESPAYSGWQAQNAATAALDLVAVLLALALTQDWGLRLPAWLVLVPIWVGTGFLVPAFVEVVVDFLHGLTTSGQLVSMQDGLVENWTYVIVGSSFAVQGLLLGGAFVLYARQRWAEAIAELPVEPERGTTFPVQRVLGITGAVLAAVIAVLHLYQAVLAPAALRTGEWTFATRVVEAVEGIGALLAVLGVLALVGTGARRLLPTRGRFTTAVVFTWIGAGSLFAYGFFRTLSNVLKAPLSDTITPLNRAVSLGALLAGLIIGIAAVLLLSERSAVVRAEEAAEGA